MKQIITARTVLAGSELEEIQNGAVVVEDGKVVKVVPAEQLTEEDRAQAECIAFEDETVLPGLIEGHNHLSIDARKSNHLEILGTATECKLTLLAEEGLYDDLLSGVTTVRISSADRKDGIKSCSVENTPGVVKILSSFTPLATLERAVRRNSSTPECGAPM